MADLIIPEMISVIDLFNILNDLYKDIPSVLEHMKELDRLIVNEKISTGEDVAVTLDGYALIKDDCNMLILDYHHTNDNSDEKNYDAVDYLAERKCIYRNLKGRLCTDESEFEKYGDYKGKKIEPVLNIGLFYKLNNRKRIHAMFDILEKMNKDIELNITSYGNREPVVSLTDDCLKPFVVKSLPVYHYAVEGFIELEFINGEVVLTYNLRCDEDEEYSRQFYFTKNDIEIFAITYPNLYALAESAYISMDDLPSGVVKYIKGLGEKQVTLKKGLQLFDLY